MSDRRGSVRASEDAPNSILAQSNDTREIPPSEAAPAGPVGASPAPPPWPIADKDHYSVAGEYARGGLGRILEAVDHRLDRSVAVKELLKDDPLAEARFVREALVTARLQHPAIVPVYEAGRWPTGEPFYTMRMVPGRSLAEVLKETHTPEQRLALLPNIITVADAIAYAHSQGIIHRDLKPSNVLIGPFGETVVIDWGLATDISKTEPAGPAASNLSPYRMSATPMTVVGSVIGTPEYMPPEQARGQQVDERADVYTIGSILYHLLAGVPPYSGDNVDEVIGKLTSRRPPSLESVAACPKDLAAIVHKAMAREPAQRYRTAKELAQDLKLFQTGQLVRAREYSAAALALRWMRRNRLVLTLTMLFLVLSAAGGIALVQRIIAARNAAEARSRDLVLLQARASLDRDPTAALAWLRVYARNTNDVRTLAEIALDAQNRGVARHVFRTQPTTYGAFSPDSRFFASTGQDHTLRLWDLATGSSVKVLKNVGTVNVVRFSSDGKRVLFHDFESPTLQLWEPETGLVRKLIGHTGTIGAAHFSPDDKLIESVSSDRTVHIWSTSTGEGHVLGSHDAGLRFMAVSPDGKLLAAAGRDKIVRVWEVATGKCRILSGHTGELRTLAFSPTGSLLASAGLDMSIRLWDLPKGNIRRVLRGHSQVVSDLALSPDGKLLASASGDGTVGLWRVDSGAKRFLKGHVTATTSVTFSPDGKTVASAGLDGSVRLWNADDGEELRALRGHSTVVYRAMFSQDGRWLASVGGDGTARLWRLASEKVRILRGHTDQVQHLAFSPDGRSLATGSKDRSIRVWDLLTGGSVVLSGHQDIVLRVAFLPDGRTLASGSWDKTVRLWGLTSGVKRILQGHKGAVSDLVIAPDGATLASADTDGKIWLWNPTTGEGRPLVGHQAQVRSLAFSPDGKTLASASADNTVRLWDPVLATTKLVLAHPEPVRTVAFSPSGELLASAGSDGSIRIWTSATGAMKRILRGHQDQVFGIGFSPDGLLLGSASNDKTVRIWNMAINNEMVLSAHRGAVNRIVFSPDAKLVAAAGWDETVRVWEASTGMMRLVGRHSSGHVMHVGFSPDGRYLASAGMDGTVRIWPVEGILRLPETVSQWLSWINDATTAFIDENGEALTQTPRGS